MLERNWDTCIAFHGHPCPVLATGYRVGIEALRLLDVEDLHKTPLVCIAENKVCGVDAIQIMLNCTLAKGNIIIRDNGKQVYTVVRKSDGVGYRFSLRNEFALPWPDPEVWPENVGWEELIEKTIHEPAEMVFNIEKVTVNVDIPFVGHVFQYHKCMGCGELVSEYAMHTKFGKAYCNDCYESEDPRINGVCIK